MTQIVSIVFLIGVLFFVLRFKDTLARSLSGFFSAFGTSADIQSPDAPLDLAEPGTPDSPTATPSPTKPPETAAPGDDKQEGP